MKNCLILNSNHKQWPKNYKLFFLGYWCLENINNSFKTLSKYKIINNFEKSTTQVDEDVRLISSIYLNLLEDIGKSLNQFHKKNYSKKFWEIVMGPWIKVLVGIVYERYSSLEHALNKYEIDHLILADDKEFDFYSHCVEDLEVRASKNLDNWNLVLYTKIFKFLNKNYSISEIKVSNSEKNTTEEKTNIKKKIVFYLTKFLNLFKAKEDFFIFLPDLNLINIFKLNLSLGQIPKLYFEYNYKFAKKNISLRKKFNFRKKNVEKIEEFIREILPELLPTDIIENLNYLDNLTTNINWPEKPKLIFTSYGYHNSELFKIWLGKQVEKKCLYILGQHGANYFTGKNNKVESGLSTCDKFISWGDIDNEKCFPLFNSKNISIKKIRKNVGDKIFFYAPKMSRQRKRPYDDYGKMIRDNILMENILSGLDKKIQEKVVINLHSNDYESYEFERKILSEIIFKNRIYTLNKSAFSKQQIYEKSRIIIHPGDGTGLLETLSANIPTVSIMSNLNWIRNSARKDYEDLVKVKILFFKADDLIDHVNSNFENINLWWNDDEVKTIKKRFTKKYSKHPSNRPIGDLTNILKNILIK